ncbi:MAG: MOSC N-terminal beta barrel domain-containing protein [Ginsengibacter sp.]
MKQPAKGCFIFYLSYNNFKNKLCSYAYKNFPSFYFCRMLTVSELFIYPVKSLGGIPVSSAMVTDRGFQFDRRWMLVDINNRFITQRDLPVMALLRVEFGNLGLTAYHKKNNTERINIPLLPETNETATVTIFDDNCKAAFVSKNVDEWFSQMLSTNCRLVYMPDSTNRPVDENYADDDEHTTFTDGFPYVMIGQASLDDLNGRLREHVPINRFRPNIVFTGGKPYEEDQLGHFIINNINFYGIKLCARCVITTVNQENAYKSVEPLKTLATYRLKNNKIYFGQNLLAKDVGTINIGNQIDIVTGNISDDFAIPPGNVTYT